MNKNRFGTEFKGDIQNPVTEAPSPVCMSPGFVTFS